MPQPAYLPFNADVTAPAMALPVGACDCHFHVFESSSNYPLAATRSYTPTPAPLAAYQAMARTLGLSRAVLVHPSVYGPDHRSFEDTLRHNREWMRGVAVVYPDTSADDISRWHDLGARGTRCNALFEGGAAMQDLPRVISKVKDFGWHLQVLMDVNKDAEAVVQMADLGVPLVIDHYGHVNADQAMKSKGFGNLLALVREGRAWVKLSGAYRISPQRVGFSDVRPLTEALLKANSKQLVWGSDWPHPSIAAPMPNDGHLINALLDCCSPAQLQQVLVDNPTRLYWNN
jgi:2-pyrone-4,6-dicarboxylate lactonase